MKGMCISFSSRIMAVVRSIFILTWPRTLQVQSLVLVLQVFRRAQLTMNAQAIHHFAMQDTVLLVMHVNTVKMELTELADPAEMDFQRKEDHAVGQANVELGSTQRMRHLKDITISV